MLIETVAFGFHSCSDPKQPDSSGQKSPCALLCASVLQVGPTLGPSCCFGWNGWGRLGDLAGILKLLNRKRCIILRKTSSWSYLRIGVRVRNTRGPACCLSLRKSMKRHGHQRTNKNQQRNKLAFLMQSSYTWSSRSSLSGAVCCVVETPLQPKDLSADSGSVSS